MSKPTKELIKYWYKKIKEAGFKDVETWREYQDEPTLEYWDSKYFSTNGAVKNHAFHDKQEYFYRAHQFLNRYQFKNQTDHHIWEMHAEGLGLRTISKRLKEQGIKLNKDSVATVVKRLRQKMREIDAICESEN